MAMSQVPGLSNLLPEENRTNSYIKATDSDYVKFAKQGGDRDLLVAHEIEKSTAPKMYQRVDWFDHIHNDEEDAKNRKVMPKAAGKKQEIVTPDVSARQEGSMIKEKYTRGGVPFHTDNMSVWERTKQHPEAPPMENKHRKRPTNSLF